MRLGRGDCISSYCAWMWLYRAVKLLWHDNHLCRVCALLHRVHHRLYGRSVLSLFKKLNHYHVHFLTCCIGTQYFNNVYNPNTTFVARGPT